MIILCSQFQIGMTRSEFLRVVSECAKSKGLIQENVEEKAHHSFRSVANALQLDESTVRSHLQDRNIKCFKKIKRNLIPETQKEARRKCAMNLRKTIWMSDVPNMLFLDECYICVGKYFDYQNERCYGYSLETISDGKNFKQFPR
ncbi:hypothetical protein BV898_10338 [Hypsibius exemplaris]|uniref:Uncharacterized protein n=1 Tax=Hypsibius exemplaris TaxID=2072580 RepID=A0A1W0WK14_HYPEX|nr:hypothetical protein BV898_10338 [Hypsibius exemplaris]